MLALRRRRAQVLLCLRLSLRRLRHGRYRLRLSELEAGIADGLDGEAAILATLALTARALHRLAGPDRAADTIRQLALLVRAELPQKEMKH